MMTEETWLQMRETARASFERQVAAGTAAQADARIKRLRELGMHERAGFVLAARIKAFGAPAK